MISLRRCGADWPGWHALRPGPGTIFYLGLAPPRFQVLLHPVSSLAGRSLSRSIACMHCQCLTPVPELRRQNL